MAHNAKYVEVRNRLRTVRKVNEDFRKELANEIMKSDKFANTFSPTTYKGGK